MRPLSQIAGDCSATRAGMQGTSGIEPRCAASRAVDSGKRVRYRPAYSSRLRTSSRIFWRNSSRRAGRSFSGILNRSNTLKLSRIGCRSQAIAEYAAIRRPARWGPRLPIAEWCRRRFARREAAQLGHVGSRQRSARSLHRDPSRSCSEFRAGHLGLFLGVLLGGDTNYLRFRICSAIRNAEPVR